MDDKRSLVVFFFLFYVCLLIIWQQVCEYPSKKITLDDTYLRQIDLYGSE